MFEVFKIGITKSNDQSIKEVKQISLLAGKGIVGDLHFHEYNDARKQLTLIESENIDYYNKNLSFGYINTDLSNENLLIKNLFIEVEKKKYPALLENKPLKYKIFA